MKKHRSKNHVIKNNIGMYIGGAILKLFTNPGLMISLLGMVSFSIGAMIQIFFLYKYGWLSFFSASQTLIDSLVVLPYVFCFILLPFLSIPFMTWTLDEWINSWSAPESLMSIFGMLIWVFYGFGGVTPVLMNIESLDWIKYTVYLSIIPILLLLNIWSYWLFYSSKKGMESRFSMWSPFFSRDVKMSILALFLVLPLIGSMSFDINIVNLVINWLLLTFVLSWFSWVIHTLINIKMQWKAKNIQKDKASSEPSLNMDHFGFVAISSMILFWFCPLFYALSGYKYIDTQMKAPRYAIINQQKELVLYKNDKYLFLSWALDSTNVISVDKVDYYLNNKVKSWDTIDNFIKNYSAFFSKIMDTFIYIVSGLSDAIFNFLVFLWLSLY